jgi:hypothetical protein
MVDRKNVPTIPEAPPKRGRGRPATGRVRNQMIGVRCSPEERAQIEFLAAKAGMTAGQWMLHRALISDDNHD